MLNELLVKQIILDYCKIEQCHPHTNVDKVRQNVFCSNTTLSFLCAVGGERHWCFYRHWLVINL